MCLCVITGSRRNNKIQKHVEIPGKSRADSVCLEFNEQCTHTTKQFCLHGTKILVDISILVGMLLLLLIVCIMFVMCYVDW